MKIIKWIICLHLSLLLVGCDVSLNFSNRSGTLEDDYVAEPLSDNSLKYERALEISNNIIQLIKDIKYQAAYNKYFSNALKAQISADVFVDHMNRVQSTAGVLTDFKPMQWGFFTGKDKGMHLLYSVKIAKHKQSMMKYLFVFNHDGDFGEIVGFNVKVRGVVPPPGVY